VDRDERCRRPWAPCVEGTSRELFARARFAAHEHGGTDPREDAQVADHRAEAQRVSDERGLEFGRWRVGDDVEALVAEPQPRTGTRPGLLDADAVDVGAVGGAEIFDVETEAFAADGGGK